MGTSEKFCLQWNEFQNNLKSSYRGVRKTEDYSDVTLVCEDGQQIAAHRIILSSSSIFFRDLLARNPHSHPLVYMRAVQYGTLASIVDFIYHGEAEVRKEELESFLEMAGELSVKGMTKQVKKDKKVEEETAPKEKTVSQNVEDISSRHFEAQDEESDDSTKDSPRTLKYSHTKQEVTNVQEIVQNIYSSRMEEQDEDVKESFPCDVCGKTYGTKGSLRTHKYNHTKAPGPVKNEKVDNLELSSKERDSETSLELFEREERVVQGTDRSLDNSFNRSLEKSFDMSLDRSLDRTIDRSLDRTIDRSPLEAELEERIDAITELKDGLWTCLQCGKTDKSRFHLRRHAETHIEGFTHPCTSCEKTFTQRDPLKKHKLRDHPEEREVKLFICDTCNMPSKTKASLAIHKQRQHRNEQSVEPLNMLEFV